MDITTPANPANFSHSQDVSPVRTSDWFWTLFLTAIPLVGLIMLLVWAFGGGNNLNKSNWAKATLLWILVITVFYALIFIVFGLSFLGTNY
jgi:sterol desaturase/sphingolipid hydroxylase (fatty acid hydroxylase superfamily)